jgi:hypothetical protein
MTQLRISSGDLGSYTILALDSSGTWVIADPSEGSYATRAEAQESVDLWLSLNDDMVQVADEPARW